MKFYKNKSYYGFYHSKILSNKLTAIYSYSNVLFFKNASLHNTKNTAYIRYDGTKEFCLNGTSYGNHNDFTKQSWRKFYKLQVLL